MVKQLTIGVVLVLLVISAIACGKKELSYAEKEHQKKIETSLRFSERGWLVEASDGLVYKVQGVIGRSSEVSQLELTDSRSAFIETVGRGDCLRCAAYFVRVAIPTSESYRELALQFAKQ